MWMPLVENILSRPCFIATFWASITINGLGSPNYGPKLIEPGFVSLSKFSSSIYAKISSSGFSYLDFLLFLDFDILLASCKLSIVHPIFSNESLMMWARTNSSFSWGHFTPVEYVLLIARYDLSGKKPKKWFSSGSKVVPMSWRIFIYCSSSWSSFWILFWSSMYWLINWCSLVNSYLKFGFISNIVNSSPSSQWRVSHKRIGERNLSHSLGTLKTLSRTSRHISEIYFRANDGRVVLKTDRRISSSEIWGSMWESSHSSSSGWALKSLLASDMQACAMNIKIKLMCYIFIISFNLFVCLSMSLR